MTTTTPTQSRALKAEAVREAIIKQWRTMSDRDIAKRLGVSNRTVSNHRK